MTAHRVLYDLHNASYVLPDPGDAGTLTLNGRTMGHFNITTAGASEARTLPVPSKAGLIATVVHTSDGGDFTLTITSGYNQDADTTLAFAEAGDFVTFMSFETASSTYRWRVIGFEGVSVTIQEAQTFSGKVTTESKFVAGGTTAAGDAAAVGYAATDGLILTGQGSTNDITIKNDAGTAVINIPTGATGVDVVGALSAATIEAGSLILSIADGTNTLAMTQATHANRILLVLDATLATTLPEATGTGDYYHVVQGIAATSSTFTTADTTNADYVGGIHGGDTDADAAYTWHAAQGSGYDVITFNGTSTGGKIYDWVKFTDIATDVWLVDGLISQSGGSEATPFSST